MSKYELVTRLGPERPKKKGKNLDRLTRDAIAAQQAGMSYGQWKAQHPHTPDEDDEADLEKIAPGMVLVPCEHCGALFEKKKDSKKKYCCEECRHAHQHVLYVENAKKMREKARAGKTAACCVCGKEFVTDHQHRKYCSTECAVIGQRRRTKALKKQYKEATENGSN